MRDERVELRRRAAEVLVAELADDALEERLRAVEHVGRLVLERLELEEQVLLEAREHAEERLLGEAHRLQLACEPRIFSCSSLSKKRRAKRLLASASLRSKTLASLPVAKEALELAREGGDELRLELPRRPRGGSAALARGLRLQRAQLGDDLRRDRVELGVRLEVRAVEGDLRLHLLVAEGVGELGERELVGVVMKPSSEGIGGASAGARGVRSSRRGGGGGGAGREEACGGRMRVRGWARRPGAAAWGRRPGRAARGGGSCARRERRRCGRARRSGASTRGAGGTRFIAQFERIPADREDRTNSDERRERLERCQRRERRGRKKKKKKSRAFPHTRPSSLALRAGRRVF